MAHIFIFDNCVETVLNLTYVLESEGHIVSSNLVTKPCQQFPVAVTDPVDVLALVASLKRFPDLIIAESKEVNGVWLGRLIHSLELGQNCPILLISHSENSEGLDQLLSISHAYFYPKPFNLLHLSQYIEHILSESLVAMMI